MDDRQVRVPNSYLMVQGNQHGALAEIYALRTEVVGIISLLVVPGCTDT